MRKIGAFVWYQTLHFDGWIQKWSDHTPLRVFFPVSNECIYREKKCLYIFKYRFIWSLFLDAIIKCYLFIHSFWWPTNWRAGKENTRSALIVSNGTLRAPCVCAYRAICYKSLLRAARVRRLYFRNMVDFINYVVIV